MRFTVFASVLTLLTLGNARAQVQSCHAYTPAPAATAVTDIPNIKIKVNINLRYLCSDGSTAAIASI
jgi:hypothetical protein